MNKTWPEIFRSVSSEIFKPSLHFLFEVIRGGISLFVRIQGVSQCSTNLSDHAAWVYGDAAIAGIVFVSHVLCDVVPIPH